MSTDLSELTCPDCGARDQREAFCDSCGAALSRAKPAAAGTGATAFEEAPAEEPLMEKPPAEEPSTAPIPNPRSASASNPDAGSVPGGQAESQTAADESGPVPVPEFVHADSGSAGSESADTRTGDTRTGETRTGETRTGDTRSAETRTGETRTGETRTAEAESTEAKWAEAESTEAARAEAERADAARAEAERAEAARLEAEQAEAAERAERARALLVPVADQSAPGGILPVLPGLPEPIVPQRRESERLEALDAGIECQWCSIRNPPERHFCRRCGQRLAYAPVQARRPSWWRRLIFFWRNRPLPYAGQRPRLRRGPGQAIRPIVWTAVVVVAVVVVVNEYTPVSANVRDHFAKPNEISNWTIAASHEDPNHPAKLLHDTYSDTWWGSGFAPQNSNGVSLTVTFSQPVNLLDMGLTPGAGTAADAFGAQGSPETVDAELIPIPGKGAPIKKTFTLDDQPGFQKFELRGDDVRQVVLTVTSSYQPTSVNPPKAVETAITELEFYTRH